MLSMIRALTSNRWLQDMGGMATITSLVGDSFISLTIGNTTSLLDICTNILFTITFLTKVILGY